MFLQHLQNDKYIQFRILGCQFHLMIPEHLLHFIWRFRLFDQDSLMLHSGESLEIISPGNYHQDSGPDFQNARIRIDETLWAGNIEIHLRSSDWFRHHHETDAAYNNIILHVV